MGEKLPPDQMELYRRTDEILHYIWDPIGISDAPYARDEYHGYLPHVYSLLLKNDKEGIRSYLLDVTENRMGLESSEWMRERVGRTVETLFAWKDKCLGNADPSANSG
jgi:hypothetical protein